MASGKVLDGEAASLEAGACWPVPRPRRDSLSEDLNGNGRLDSDDVVSLFRRTN